MHYIIEALFVGVYSVILYLLLTPFTKNIYILLLVVGFLKHILGSILGIHQWYCNNGYACKNIKHREHKVYSEDLIIRSILESLIYLSVGIMLIMYLEGVYLFFVIGFIMHILSEILLVHRYFCVTSCK